MGTIATLEINKFAFNVFSNRGCKTFPRRYSNIPKVEHELLVDFRSQYLQELSKYTELDAYDIAYEYGIITSIITGNDELSPAAGSQENRIQRMISYLLSERHPFRVVHDAAINAKYIGYLKEWDAQLESVRLHAPDPKPQPQKNRQLAFNFIE